MSTIQEMIDGIRDLVHLKEFPDSTDSLVQKLLWAYNELSEAILAHMQGDPIKDIQTEFIDVIFYVLDFWGIAQRDIYSQNGHPMYFTEIDDYISYDEPPYGTIEEMFSFNLGKLGQLTDLFKKGKDWISIEVQIGEIIQELANSTYWYGKFKLMDMKLNNVELPLPSIIFQEKLDKNLGREKHYGQTKSITTR